MKWTTLITCDDLNSQLTSPGVVIVDCRFNLSAPEAGERAYLEGHISGAIYAHLERDLSASMSPGSGRHPLPSAQALNRTFSSFGIGPDCQVVAYDDAGGATAGRLWWLLRFMGHEAVAVLDGGLKAWRAAGLEVLSGSEQRTATTFVGTGRTDWIVEATQVQSAERLIDARHANRFCGDEEPLDPVAGHIPGAFNHCFQDNLDADGTFLAPEKIKDKLLAVLRGVDISETVFYCGSGVTACHNLLAAEYAGLGTGRLYPGSWSEWCADPRRPVATGSVD